MTDMPIAVIGAGSLGLKIAGTLAFCGLKVCVYDSNPKVLHDSLQNIKHDMEVFCQEGVLNALDYMGNLNFVSNLGDAVKTCEFIFESIPEELNLKQDLFQKISEFCNKDAIIATSSLNLKCDDVVQKALHRNRCLGVRFLYPVYWVPEVEINPCIDTSSLTLEKVRLFLSKIGKVAYFRSGSNPLVLDEKQIKQKRAAFIASFQNGNKQSNPKTLIPELSSDASRKSLTNETLREKECAICMNEDRNCLFSPCRHLCSCYSCGLRLFGQGDVCPICREPIESVIEVYHA